MNVAIEDVFLFDDLLSGRGIGFITAGLVPPGFHIGCIVKHEKLGASFVAYACHPTVLLLPIHLKSISRRLKKINEQEKSHQENQSTH